MTYREFIEEADKKYGEVATLLEKNDSLDESKVKGLMDEAEKLKAKAFRLKDIEEQRQTLKGYTKPDANGGAAQPDGSKFREWKEFIAAVAMHHERIDKRLSKFVDNDEKNAEAKDMTGLTGASGGFLIPTEFQATLQAVVAENAIVRPRATIIPMTRRQVLIPVLDQSQSLGTGVPRWFGGLKVYWATEASQKTASDALFKQMTLTANKLIMFTRASDELLDDSAISLSAFLSGQMGFAGAITWNEDYAFLQGDDVGKPLGVLNSGATYAQSRAGGGAIDYTDLTKMLMHFLPTGKGVWLVSQSAMNSLITMNGPSGNPSYVWGSAVQGQPNSLLGYPVIWTEKLPALGTKGDVMLCDFSYYLIGDRQATTVESTKFEKWEYDETSWRAVHRVDGRPWLNNTLTYQDGSTQVSPFVALN